MDGFNNENNNVNATEPVTEAASTEPAYTPDYNAYQPQQDAYQQQNYYETPQNTTYQSQPNLQGFQREVAKCPGKEIAGLVCGINAIVWSALGTVCGCIPVYGIIFAVIWGLFGIGFGIAAIVLHKKVHEQAEEITSKIETGKKLGTAGIIVGAAGIVISIIALILMVSIWGVAIGSSVINSVQQSTGGGITF